MINSASLRRTLVFLDEQYKVQLSSSDELRPILISKMALLEYCGWLESCFDEIARCGTRKSLSSSEAKTSLNRKIDGTHGFHYDSKVKPLLMAAIGAVSLWKVEQELEKNGSLQILKSQLGMLNKKSQIAAHTSTKATQTFDAPSTIKSQLNKSEPIIENIWNLVKE